MYNQKKNTNLVVDITQKLIRCKSVTPKDDGVMTVISEILKNYNFKVHDNIVFSQKNTQDVRNLFAIFGSGNKHLSFAGHVDVVSPGDFNKWMFNPFSGNIYKNKIFGRGAVDMKGAIAAFISAVILFIKNLKKSFNGTISLLITGDEEGEAINGTKKLIDWVKLNNYKINHCIVGEPTNTYHIGDNIKIGRRGSLSGTIEINGKQGHVAYPELASNPIPNLLSILLKLNNLIIDTGTNKFQPSNLEIVSCNSYNKQYNIIPEISSANFNIRFNNLWTINSLKKRILNLINSVELDKKNIIKVLFKKNASESFLTKNNDLINMLSASIKNITSLTPKISTNGGTSDARFIYKLCPVIEFGLINKTMHQINEYVKINDLIKLESIYLNFLNKYFY